MIEVKVDGTTGYWCLSCGGRFKRIVIIREILSLKRKVEVNLNFHTYLCETCFKRMFGVDNWLRVWRINKRPLLSKVRRK